MDKRLFHEDFWTFVETIVVPLKKAQQLHGYTNEDMREMLSDILTETNEFD